MINSAFDELFNITGNAKRQRRTRRDGRAVRGVKMVNNRMVGICQVFSLVNGFGNILGADGKSYFVHQNSIAQPFTDHGFCGLIPGMTVTFVPKQTDKGLQAEIVLIEEYKGLSWAPLKMEPRIAGNDSGYSNVWEALDGKINVIVSSNNGVVSNNVQPALLIPETETAVFHTNPSTKSLVFTLPSDRDTSALALDKDKKPVAPDSVPLGGFILLAKRKQNGDIFVVVRRFGKRYDKIASLNGDLQTNVVIVEQRLFLELGPAPVAAEVEAAIRDQADDVLVEHTVDFVPAIMNAIAGLR